MAVLFGRSGGRLCPLRPWPNAHFERVDTHEQGCGRGWLSRCARSQGTESLRYDRSLFRRPYCTCLYEQIVTTGTAVRSSGTPMPPFAIAPILRTSDLTKSFAGNVVLDRVGFDVYPGEIHALMGENGAGKSTWINLVTGVHQPDSGTIEFDGATFTGLTPHQAEAIGIATVHQELSLSPHLTVAENIF